MTYLAPRGSEPPPLPDGVVERWAALSADADILRFRVGVYRRASKLWQRMSLIERRHADGTGVCVDGVAQLWAWVCTLALNLGRPENTTCAAYAERVASLLTWCRATGRDFGALDVQDFDAWIRGLCLEHGNSVNSRITKMAAARGFFHWRFVHRLGDDRSQYVALPKNVRKLPTRYSEEQLAGMFESVGKRPTPELQVRDKAILMLLLSSGIRLSELWSLNIHDLDLRKQSGTIRVHGKGCKKRDVPIEGPVVQALTDWLGVRETLPFTVDPDAVFVVLHTGYIGRRIERQGLMLLIKHHAQNAGLRKGQYGAHRFRSTYATALYDDGADIREIQLLLGHEDVETTLRYIAISNRARKARLSPQRQHRALGKPGGGQPRWMAAALGALRND